MKARQKPRPIRDHPLQNVEGGAAGGAGPRAGGFGGGAAQMRIDARDPQERDADGEGSEDEGGIEDKLKAVSLIMACLA